MSWYEDPGLPPAGWYPDPDGHGHRWWDGQGWTEHYAGAPQPVPQYPPPVQHYAQQPPPQPAAAPATAPAANVLPPPEFWAAFVAIVLLAAGSVAPWVTIELGDSLSRDVGGLRGDGPGVITLLAAVTTGVLVCLWLFERAVLLPLSAAVVALIAVAVAVEHLADPAGDTEVPPALDLSPGWGAWVSLIAALVLLAATVGMAVRARTQPRDEGPGAR